MFKRREAFVQTKDDWSPNYPNNTVRVFLSQLPRMPNDEITYRIGVWGMDDLAMDKDFVTNNPEEAIKLYEKLISRESIEKEYLLSIGFNYF